MNGISMARQALQEHFGFNEFLDGQEGVVSQILEGRDGLVVMPTGGGKSLCYQLPALCLEGVTLVVSPLIALMKDQVDALVARGVAATMINSTLSWPEQKERLEAMRVGRYKLVYVSPERFRAESFMEVLRGVSISLVAIDEAHCLSQWGHDFRPDYMRLGKVLKALGQPQCVALTATATPVVRADIHKVLALRDPFDVVSGFARPNLALTITAVEKQTQKYARLKAVIREHRTGIIYCSTRKRVEEVAETLHDWGLKIVAYHGGMNDAERERAQNVFISKEADVAVATNAFGMGIDRSDVRFVVHFEIPGSVEAYYQEAGRAGRDGESAACELFFNYADTRTQEFFIDGANPGAPAIRDLYQFLRSAADARHEVHRTLEEMAEGIGVRNSMTIGSALAVLARAGVIERFDIPGQRAKGTRLKRPEVAARDLEFDQKALEEKEHRDRDKLKSMVELCYARVCRQQWILDYFGEAGGEPCGLCDVCTDADNGAARAPRGNEDTLVRKALSGVARMSVRHASGWEGKFGRTRIVQMLTGSRAKEILAANLDRLTTYGILSDQPTAYVNGLFRSLHDAGLIFTQKGEFPLVTLTDRGERVMRGELAYQIVWPESHGSSAGASVTLQDAGFDAQLFSRLKELRARIAKADGVPPYVIFPNKTLECLARLRPVTEEAGRVVHGVGEAKAQRYLAPFLREIAAWKQLHG
jgi:ATP-dependent DNA helicase RecQ